MLAGLLLLAFVGAAGHRQAGADEAPPAAPAVASPVETAETAFAAPAVPTAAQGLNGRDPATVPAGAVDDPESVDAEAPADAAGVAIPRSTLAAEPATPTAAAVEPGGVATAVDAEATAPDEPAPTAETEAAAPVPTASPAAPAESTAAVAPAPTAPTGAPRVELSAGGARAADPGETVRFAHLITAATGGVVDVVATSSEGWKVALVAEDGIGLLADHDGDGLADTGPLEPGGVRRIAVEVTVPLDALAGTEDTTTVAVMLGEAGRTQVATAIDTTAVNAVLTLTIESADVAFGRVTATGEVAPGLQGVVGVVDARGAYYVREGAVRVTVASNGPWAGSCHAGDAGDHAGGIRVADGRLEWRLAGSTAWTAFVPGVPSAPYDNACFPSTGVGTTTFVYDLRLRVEATDAAGSFEAAIVFEASPSPFPAP